MKIYLIIDQFNNAILGAYSDPIKARQNQLSFQMKYQFADTSVVEAALDNPPVYGFTFTRKET